MKINARVLDLDGKAHDYAALDRVSFINNESFGPGEKIGNIGTVRDELVLVVNVNGITAAAFQT